uniref:3-oxoacyl-[acyl-carrier-protein] reductase n=1 Tax=Hucho hucho TaxID=62062 RepID=A0A4W5LTJ6_9TELE
CATSSRPLPAMSHPKTVLITGADRGIGLAIACRLAAYGWRIALHGLADDAAREAAMAAVRTAGASEVIFLGGDLRDSTATQQLAQAALVWHGRIDVLVNNAGMQYTSPLTEMPAAMWDSIIAVNLSAAFHLMQACLPGMLAAGWGRVVNIASVHGLVASVNKAPYVASKFGIIGLSRAAALETAGSGVTVNAICPGWVETALIEPQILARMRELVLEKQPSGQMSQPADIAEAVAMLCGDWAHNLTGVALPLDGGWTAQYQPPCRAANLAPDISGIRRLW